jgi:hypothetical protein
MHPRVREPHVVFRLLTAERDVARRLIEHVLDKRAWQADPAVIAQNAARPRENFDSCRR